MCIHHFNTQAAFKSAPQYLAAHPRFSSVKLFSYDDSLEGKMAVDPLKNQRCWIKAQIFAQRASSGAAGVKVYCSLTSCSPAEDWESP
jgi:hypothetical protein